MGLCPARLDYAHLNTAFRILAREHPARAAYPGPPALVAAHAGRFLEAPSGGLALGPGPFVAALEHAVLGLKARVVGKPSRAFFEAVIEDIDAFGSVHVARRESITHEPGARIAIIGDDFEADLGEGARELGLWRVLGAFSSRYAPSRRFSYLFFCLQFARESTARATSTAPLRRRTRSLTRLRRSSRASSRVRMRNVEAL